MKAKVWGLRGHGTRHRLELRAHRPLAPESSGHLLRCTVPEHGSFGPFGGLGAPGPPVTYPETHPFPS